MKISKYIFKKFVKWVEWNKNINEFLIKSYKIASPPLKRNELKYY